MFIAEVIKAPIRTTIYKKNKCFTFTSLFLLFPSRFLGSCISAIFSLLFWTFWRFFPLMEIYEVIQMPPAFKTSDLANEIVTVPFLNVYWGLGLVQAVWTLIFLTYHRLACTATSVISRYITESRDSREEREKEQMREPSSVQKFCRGNVSKTVLYRVWNSINIKSVNCINTLTEPWCNASSLKSQV